MHQLVLQFSPLGSNEEDFDKLIALEDQLIETLAGHAEVDGHDVGSNEGNVFVFSHNAEETFVKCFPVVERSGLLPLLAAGYRDVDGEDYMRIWPQGDTSRFSLK